jgi:cytochrome P450
MTDERKQRANDGIVALYEYVDRLVVRRRSDPGDDLVSALVHVEEAGDRLTRDELLAMVVNIIGGAVGSSEAAICNAAYLFSSHPDQAQIVRDDPSIDRDVIEECLRYAPPFRSTRRKALEPIDVVGVHLDVDDTIMVSRQAANRDSERFRGPASLRCATRRSAARGVRSRPPLLSRSALARANLTDAIPIMVRRCGDLEVTTDPIRREPFGPTEKFEELRMRFLPGRVMISADSHVIEPPDVWTAASREWGERAPQVRRDDDGNDWWYVDGHRTNSFAGGTQSRASVRGS